MVDKLSVRALALTCLAAIVFVGCAQPAAEQSSNTESAQWAEIQTSFGLNESRIDLTGTSADDGLSQSQSQPQPQSGEPQSSEPLSGNLPPIITAIDPLLFAGEIRVGGSSTVFPITSALAERFIDDGFPDLIEIKSTGTTAGFDEFCRTGQLHVVNASRRMTAAENELCRQNGRTPIFFRIGSAKVAIVKNDRNFWLDNISASAIEALINGEKWSDVNSLWPARPIERLFPQIESDSMRQINFYLFQNGAARVPDKLPNTRYYQFEQELLRDLAADENAIGIVSYRTVTLLSTLPISTVAVNNIDLKARSRYPLERLLYIYSDVETLASEPQVASFIAFYLAHMNEEIDQAGFFPLSNLELTLERLKFQREVGDIRSIE